MPRVSTKYSLQVVNPALAKEWHPSRNGSLTPSNVVPGTSKKVWWLCKEGHEWQARINSRNGGARCPFCTNHIVNQDNCLLIVNPRLAEQWHPSKNGTLTPEDVSPGSAKKVWWVCNKSHEWEARIQNRNRGQKCPVCTNHIVNQDNCLLIVNPRLAEQWHPSKNRTLTPADVLAASYKRVWWICQKGHEWKAAIKGRRGCPYCTRRYLPLERSLEFRFPDIARELHPSKNSNLRARDLSAFSNTKVWWLCPKQHEYQAVVGSRTGMGTGCTICKPGYSRLELRIYCELKAIFDEVNFRKRIVKKECDVYLPRIKVAIEIDGYPWHEGREAIDRLKSESLSQIGIKVYRVRDKRLVKLSDSDIITRIDNPRQTDQSGVIKKLVSLLISDAQLNQEENERATKYLADNQFKNDDEFRDILSALPGPPPGQSLKDIHPEKAKYWDHDKNFPLIPELFTPQSHQEVWWKCPQGHEQKQRIQNRVLQPDTGCGTCNNQKKGEDRSLEAANEGRSLADEYPELIAEWHPTKNANRTPFNVSTRSGIVAWWVCNKGHEWDAPVSYRTADKKYGCPYCSNMRVGNDNNLEVLYKDIAKEWHPTKNGTLKPSQVGAGTPRKVWWLCAKGHEYLMPVRERAIFEHKCPYCSGKRVSRENNLEYLFPEIAAQWHPTKNDSKKPSDYNGRSGQYAWWLCDKEHEWRARIIHRTLSRSGCPECAKSEIGNKLRTASIRKRGDLRKNYPAIALQWHPTKNGDLRPEDFSKKSHGIAWWQCQKGHEYQEKIINMSRRLNPLYCPICKIQK